MNAIVEAQGLSKRYGDFFALSDIDLRIGAGRIVGLIGPNGAGKTTALRCMLGLSTFDGNLSVMGKRPDKDRVRLLQEVAYIADTAVLPTWITVSQLLEHIDGVHSKFSKERARHFLDNTNIRLEHQVKNLSKGMITQLHLALAISIDAKLLVLDEPTLGLDILYRKQFYEQLVSDFFDAERTIIITTHQVEEIEHLLTDLLFIKQGRIVLDMEMEQLAHRFVELEIRGDNLEQARRLGPISERSVLGGKTLLFENVAIKQLSQLGKVGVPSIADLFVAKMS